MRKLLLLLLLTGLVRAQATSQYVEPVTQKVYQALTSIDPSVELYLSGGFARSLVGLAVHSEPFAVKDFDYSVVMNVGSYDEALALAHKLEAAGLGRLRQVVRKPWINGWGFFLEYPVREGTIDLDFAFYPSYMAKRETAGIMNIDTIDIAYTPSFALRDLPSPLIIDPKDGYRAWRSRNPKIDKPHELVADPFVGAIRVVRTFNKFDLDLDAETYYFIKRLVDRSLPPDESRLWRHLTYAFRDPNTVKLLNRLSNLGVIRHISLEFDRILATNTPEDLERVLVRPSPHGPQKHLKFANFIWLTSPNEQQRVIRFFESIYPEWIEEFKAATCKRSLSTGE